jgi:universal stress protein A
MHHYQTILAAVDFSAHSEQALARALQLAQIYHARLQVLHVVDIPTYPVLEDVAVTGMPGVWDTELSGVMMEEAGKKLAALGANLNIPQEQLKIMQGLAGDEIVTYAQTIHADLIVMGKYGLSGWKRLLGSTTDNVIHHAKCDVLAIKLD